MKKRTFTAYCDPGHGWVKVSKKVLSDLGLTSEISGYSYQRGDFAFLEEDRDASLLYYALKKSGINAIFKCKHTNRQSKIRNYASYVGQ